MKKIFVAILTMIILAFMGGIIFMLFNSSKSTIVSAFNVADYKWELETFSSDMNVGEVADLNTAVEKAKRLWIDKFGTVNGKTYDPTRGRKLDVFYDSNNDCWLIKGTLPSNTKGSVPCAIICRDGKVLAVWMG